MKIIIHRCNTSKDLKLVNLAYGVEIDIRSYGGKLILHHDPYVQGEDFNDWIKEYKHAQLILNVKEEGLEDKILKILTEHKVKNYFFLDQSFPFLIKYSNLGEKNCAARISEFESIETLINLQKKIKWVWVDCFTKFPLSNSDIKILKKMSFNICIVSPELQKRDSNNEILNFINEIRDLDLLPDAVCTKRPDLWEKF